MLAFKIRTNSVEVGMILPKLREFGIRDSFKKLATLLVLCAFIVEN